MSVAEAVDISAAGTALPTEDGGGLDGDASPTPYDVLERAMSDAPHLWAPPDATSRIIAVAQDPSATAARLAGAVAADPHLSGRVLALVNSPFFGLPGTIGSVERAGVLLGLNAVKNVALAASLAEAFRGPGTDTLWAHSVSVGVAARELARQVKPSLAEEAFLAGVAHDLGRLAFVGLSVPVPVPCVAADVCQIERQLVGTDHAQLGGCLARRWGLPRSCQQAAGFHCHPEGADDAFRALVDLVRAADALCALPADVSAPPMAPAAGTPDGGDHVGKPGSEESTHLARLIATTLNILLPG